MSFAGDKVRAESWRDILARLADARRDWLRQQLFFFPPGLSRSGGFIWESGAKTKNCGTCDIIHEMIDRPSPSRTAK